MKFIKKVLCLVLLFSALPVFADFNLNHIDDSAEIRRHIIKDWLTCPVELLRKKNEEILVNDVGRKFQVRVEEKLDDYAVIVAPESEIAVDMEQNGTHKTIKAVVYPEGARGSWVLYRNKKTGAPVKIFWYFNSDDDVYLILRAAETKTFADLMVCSSYAARSVPLGMPFERLYAASFQELKTWTRISIPWEKVSVIPGQYYDSLQMAGMIRHCMDQIEYADDAAYDERGNLKSVFTGKDFVLPDAKTKIHYLSGPGFLKWIIDGIIEPITGKGTKIQDLTEPTVVYNVLGKSGVMSQKWNISYTLDWVRNLAAENMSVTYHHKVGFEDSGVDVNFNYFVGDSVNGVLVNSTGYIKDTGYETGKIKSLLYVLANTEPDWFYLVAVRQQSVVKPDELVFNNCAVFFPYFDDAGKFGCIVFDQGKEFTLDEFIENYPNSYVHLERVHATDNFFPYLKK